MRIRSCASIAQVAASAAGTRKSCCVSSRASSAPCACRCPIQRSAPMQRSCRCAPNRRRARRAIARAGWRWRPACCWPWSWGERCGSAFRTEAWPPPWSRTWRKSPRRGGAPSLPVPTPELREVLRNSHLRLAGGAGIVSYASSCQFRGHRVPHLVIQTESGPVTVMVLVHEPVAAPVNFDEQGYRGVIVPVAGHGSLAVLTRGAADAADRRAHRRTSAGVHRLDRVTRPAPPQMPTSLSKSTSRRALAARVG